MSIDKTSDKFSAKNQLRAVSSSPTADEPLALIDCGDVNFLISSKDIVTLMSAQKMSSPTLSFACGEVVLEDSTLPVFAINKALQAVPERASNHLTVVVIRHQQQLFGLSCATLEKIEINDLQFFSVPISMGSRKQPFSEFAVVNNRAAGLTSAINLVRLLESRGVILPVVADHRSIQEAS